MDFSTIATRWTNLDRTARVLILTEPERLPLAGRIAKDMAPYAARVEIADVAGEWALGEFTPSDLLMVLLTVDGFIFKGYNARFSPFSKPAGFAGKYVFFRLDIPEESLRTGLNTEIEKVESIVAACRAFAPGKRVRVTAEGGTDITVGIANQELITYDARALGGIAFLPPAEISEGLDHTVANGRIVADITVGELRFGPELIDLLGIVDAPVEITIENGLVADIRGGDIARRLKAGLDKLDSKLRLVVELGHGLSDLAPTGIIGVDESMNGTCHFGIGNFDPYHVDVVVRNPKFAVLEG